MTQQTDNQSSWSDEQTKAAQQIWQEYQKSHDVTNRKGQIAGIDPGTGEVWFGEWFTDIVRERREKGLVNPLWFERVGYPTALRKLPYGRKRSSERFDVV
jgi:hypothetical protein